jgi:hypothetical protein
VRAHDLLVQPFRLPVIHQDDDPVMLEGLHGRLEMHFPGHLAGPADLVAVERLLGIGRLHEAPKILGPLGIVALDLLIRRTRR